MVLAQNFFTHENKNLEAYILAEASIIRFQIELEWIKNQNTSQWVTTWSLQIWSFFYKTYPHSDTVLSLFFLNISKNILLRDAFQKKKIAEKETLVHMGGRGVKKIPFF